MTADIRTRSGPDSGDDELAGYTIGVTADRRRDELAALLEQRGARVVLAPALRSVPLADDPQLRAATHAVIDSPPDIVVATSDTGLRGWLDAADGWGLGDPLRARIGAAYLVAHGPTTRASLRVAGLTAHWSPDSASLVGVLDHLISRGVAGRTIAIQLHGAAHPEYWEPLRAAGANLVELTVHRWVPPHDLAPLRRLLDLIAGRLVDAVAFTSAPAVAALLGAAGPDRDAVLDALRDDVVAACVGPLTAAPLRRYGVPVVEPSRARLGALVATLVEELPPRARTITVAGHELTLRGHAAVVDGELRRLAPTQMAVLKALAAAPGRVLSRAALLRTLPRGADGHAVEMAVARLRAALGDSRLVQTIVKRGYRLPVE